MRVVYELYVVYERGHRVWFPRERGQQRRRKNSACMSKSCSAQPQYSRPPPNVSIPTASKTFKTKTTQNHPKRSKTNGPKLTTQQQRPNNTLRPPPTSVPMVAQHNVGHGEVFKESVQFVLSGKHVRSQKTTELSMLVLCLPNSE